jgi:hypothetical protein
MSSNDLRMQQSKPYISPSELVRARLLLAKYVPRVKLVYSPGTYVDKACFDFWPTRLALDLVPYVLGDLLEALITSEWTLERVEWAYRGQVMVDAVWVVRNAVQKVE